MNFYHKFCNTILQNSFSFLTFETIIRVEQKKKCEIFEPMEKLTVTLKLTLTESWNEPQANKSSHQRCSIKKAIFENFAILTESTCISIKKRLQHKCFLVNFAKFFKNTYFHKYLRTAASKKLQKLQLAQDFTYFNTQILSDTPFNANKVYANIIDTKG